MTEYHTINDEKNVNWLRPWVWEDADEDSDSETEAAKAEATDSG